MSPYTIYLSTAICNNHTMYIPCSTEQNGTVHYTPLYINVLQSTCAECLLMSLWGWCVKPSLKLLPRITSVIYAMQCCLYNFNQGRGIKMGFRQPAADHRFSFIMLLLLNYYDLGLRLFVGLAAGSCGQNLLPCQISSLCTKQVILGSKYLALVVVCVCPGGPLP